MSTGDAPAARKGAKPPRSRLERPKLVAAAILSAALAVFAVLNLDDVAVDWVFGTAQTPLIIVIAVSFLAGTGVGLLAGRRRGSSR